MNFTSILFHVVWLFSFRFYFVVCVEQCYFIKMLSQIDVELIQHDSTNPQ